MKIQILLILLLLAACKPIEKTEPVAILAVHNGDVLVNDNQAIAGQELKEGDIVKTLAGKASVVFFDSSVLRLDENTEITIKKIISEGTRSVELKQIAGQTWSRVLKISGVQDYKIETPTTVATVRGTGFAVKISEGDTKIMVDEGKVHVASYEEEEIVIEAIVEEDMQLEVSDENPSYLDLEPMEVTEWVNQNVEADEEFVEEVVEDYIESHPEEVSELREEFTEEQLEERVEDYVTGEIETLETAEESPEQQDTNLEPEITEPRPRDVNLEPEINPEEPTPVVDEPIPAINEQPQEPQPEPTRVIEQTPRDYQY